MHESPTQPRLPKPANIVDALQQHALTKPDEVAFRYLDSAGNETEVINYSDLLVDISA